MLSRHGPQRCLYNDTLRSLSKVDLWKAFTFHLSGRIPYISRNKCDKKCILQHVVTFRQKKIRKLFSNDCVHLLWYRREEWLNEKIKNSFKTEAVMKLPLTKPYLLEKEVASIFPTFTGEPMFFISIPTSFQTGSSFLQWPHQGA